MAIEKNQNPGGYFGAIYRENGPNGLNWQCCLAGSSKMAPRILIFSIDMGADYSIDLISIETYTPQFIGHNKIILGSVLLMYLSVRVINSM